MGSITEGILGGLQIAQRRRESDQQAKDSAVRQKQTDVAQSFAVLEALQHNQDRLNELENASSDASAKHFEAVRQETLASQALSLSKKGGDPDEQQRALEAYNVAKGVRETLDQRTLSLMRNQDTIRSQNDQLSNFMALHGVLKDSIDAQGMLQQAQQPQVAAQTYEQPSLSLPSDQLQQPVTSQGGTSTPGGGNAPAMPALPPQSPGNAAAPAQDRAQFQLDYIKQKVSPNAKIENGQVTIHTQSKEEWAQVTQRLAETRQTTPFEMNAIVVDDSAAEDRAAIREDRQAMAGERQMRTKAIEGDMADQAASQALQTAVPALRDSGMDVTTDKTGTHIVGPGGTPGSFVEVSEDPKDPTKQIVQGASQEKVAAALEASATAATKEPAAAKLIVRDMGQGINAYVKDLEAHGDLKRKGRNNEYVINVFGRDPDQLVKIAGALDTIGLKAKARDQLPKLSMPDPGMAVFQWTSGGTNVQKYGETEKPGETADRTAPRNDALKLIGYLKGYTQPEGALNPSSIENATLSVADSRKVASALAHPAGYNVEMLKNDRKFRDLLLKVIHPSQRATVAQVIDQF